MISFQNDQQTLLAVNSDMSSQIDMWKPMTGAQCFLWDCTVNFLFFDNVTLFSLPTQPRLVAQANFDRADKIPIMLLLLRPNLDSTEYTSLTFSSKLFKCSDDEALHVFSYGALVWKKQTGSFPKGLSKRQLHSDYANKELMPNELDFIPQPLALLATGNFNVGNR